MLKQSNFGLYVAPGQKKVFYDELEKGEPQYKKVFSEMDSNQAYESFTHVNGFTPWETNAEGSAIKTEDIVQGSYGEIFPKRYDKGYTISWELMQDDPNGVFKGLAGKGGSAKLLARSLKTTIEQQAAKILSNGFINSGYDGYTLFHNTHKTQPSPTSPEVKNRVDGVLNEENLKAACSLLRSQKDHSGVSLMGCIPGQLIVHPDNEFNARALLNPIALSGNKMVPNTLPNMDLVVLDHLTTPGDWFVRAKDIENLMLVWREKPIFGCHQMPGSMDWFFYGYTRFAASWVEFRGLVGGRAPAA